MWYCVFHLFDCFLGGLNLFIYLFIFLFFYMNMLIYTQSQHKKVQPPDIIYLICSGVKKDKIKYIKLNQKKEVKREK